MKILITGANGFLGNYLKKKLITNLEIVVPIARNCLDNCIALNIDENTNWQGILDGCDVVIHLAARVHQLQDNSPDSLSKFRLVNSACTLNLARQAIKSGVKRFIFISSIKVNGEQSKCSYSEASIPNPQDDYAVSKYEAEQGLMDLVEHGAMEIIIIRPPLIYGPGVKANFSSMIKWVKRGGALPFGAIKNKRSFIAIENLVDFILLCADKTKSPLASNQIFLISDGVDVSTTELLNNVRLAYGIKMPLIPVPESWLSFGLNVIGKSDLSSRLLGSLTVDISKARNLLGWEPKIDMLTQLRKMAAFDSHKASIDP